jgi:hypothetical protein
MPKIAISYRRSDSRAIVGRIYDRLAERYGSEEIFLDIDAIPYGHDFRDHVDSVLKQCAVLIVVVGPYWTGARAGGSPRILDQADPVRIEVQTGLARGMPVIPVLIDDAAMPQPSDLPDTLGQFSFLNALHIDPGLDFKVHVARLITALNQIIGAPGAAAKDTNAPALAGPAGSKTAPDGENWRGARVLLIYLILSVLVMMLAHYLIVLKLDLHFYFLQLFDILLPAAAGFLLFWNERRGWIWATLLGAGMAVLTVAGMQIVMALVAGTTLIPSTMVDWQEAFEFLASIQLATIAGNLVGRAASSSKLHVVARGRTAGGR